MALWTASDDKALVVLRKQHSNATWSELARIHKKSASTSRDVRTGAALKTRYQKLTFQPKSCSPSPKEQPSQAVNPGTSQKENQHKMIKLHSSRRRVIPESSESDDSDLEIIVPPKVKSKDTSRSSGPSPPDVKPAVPRPSSSVATRAPPAPPSLETSPNPKIAASLASPDRAASTKAEQIDRKRAIIRLKTSLLKDYEELLALEAGEKQ